MNLNRLATTGPIALKTVAVELVIAMLVLARVFQSQEVLERMSGKGALDDLESRPLPMPGFGT